MLPLAARLASTLPPALRCRFFADDFYRELIRTIDVLRWLAGVRGGDKGACRRGGGVPCRGCLGFEL